MTSEQRYKLFGLLVKGNTISDIARVMGWSQSKTLTEISKNFPHLKDIQLYKEHKTDIMQGVQQLVVNKVIDILQNVEVLNFKDLILAISVLEDKIRLQENKSTANIAIKVEDLVCAKERVVTELKQRGIPENQIEKAVSEHLKVSDKLLPLEEIETAIEYKPEPIEVKEGQIELNFAQ